MRRMTVTLAALMGATTVLAGCQSKDKAPIIPTSYYQGTTLDRNAIGVRDRKSVV